MNRSLKQRIGGALPQSMLAHLQFAQKELRSPYRLSDPQMLLHGYYSSRRWTYPEGFEEESGYVSDLAFAKRIRKLNSPEVRAAVGDKHVFAERLSAHGFADYLPRQYGLLRECIYEESVEYDGRPLFVKPIDGRGGIGLRTFESLTDCLNAQWGTGGYLVQERVQAHPYSRRIFPGSINVLRLQTGRESVKGAVEVLAITHRFGSHQSAPGDSSTAGGFLARVDLASGRLSELIRITGGGVRNVYRGHPDTGAVVEGERVPFINEAMDLVVAASQTWPDARFLGWDVAITESGPVIIEANAAWPSIGQLQVHGPASLGKIFT